MNSSYATTYSAKLRDLQDANSEDRAMALLVGGNYVAQGVLEKSLLRMLGLGPKDFVVDIGCGSGRLAWALHDDHAGRYVGTDIIGEALDYARRKVARPDWEFVQTSDTVIPVADHEADIVCFFSVLTHLQDEDCFRFLLEARRVVKPGGRIVFSFLDFELPSHWTIFDNSLRDRTPGAVLNRLHTKGTFRAWAEHLGLRLERVIDGMQAVIPLTEPIVFDDGRSQDGVAEFGQSVCVLSVPQPAATEPGSPPAAAPAPELPLPEIIEGNGELFNASVRGRITAEEPYLLAGFSLDQRPRRMLIRAIGPTLARFGVADPCLQPEFEIRDAVGNTLAKGRPFASLNGAQYLYARAFVDVGAFALEPRANDAVLIVTLPRGSHSVQVTSATGPGAVLVEMYSLPPAKFSADQIGTTIPRT